MAEVARMEAVAARLEAVAARLESGGVAFTAAPAGAAGGGGGGAAVPCVADWEALMSGSMAEFVSICSEIGGETATAGGKVKEAFEVVGNFNAMSTVCKKPAASAMAELFAPLNGGIKGVTGIKKPKDRKDPANLVLDAINGGIGALGFVAAESKSWEVVAQNIDMFQFVGDKILMTHRKEGPEVYVRWVNAYKKLLNELKDFAKAHHPCGLKWQLSGIDTSEYVPGQVATGGGGGGGGGGPAPPQPPPQAAAGGPGSAWTAIVNGSLAAFVASSNEVGDEVAEMAGHIAKSFDAVSDLLAMSAVCKKPADIGSVFGDLQTHIRACSNVKPPKRSSPLDLHHRCLKTAAGTVSFVAVDMKSWEAVGGVIEEFDFNGNKLLQQFRKSGPELYVNWHTATKAMLNDVKAFAKDQLPCGLKWDMMGKDVSEYTPSGGDKRAAPAAPAPAAGGKGGKAGPPKGGPSIKTIDNSRFAVPKRAPGEAPAMSASDAMFAELLAKKNVTAGLKSRGKKGPATDRAVVDSRAKDKKPAGDKPKAKSRFPMKDEYVSMDQYKLAYCYGERASRQNKTIKIENPRKDAVLIMECEDVNIDIVGVCKNISIAGCKRFRVTLEGSIGQVEVSNVQSGYLTINGKVYQISCDKCDGLEVTLTPEAYSAKIVSSCCSSLNIGLDNPDKKAEMEFLTLAVPSQFESFLKIDGDKAEIVTTPVDHNFG